MSSRPVSLAAALLLATSLGGCLTVGPDYSRPAVPAPEAFRAADSTLGAPPAEGWWHLFGDSELDRLIDVALAENADLRIAAARVDEARALLGVSRASRFPEIGASASAGRSKFSTETTPVPEGTPTEFNRLQAGLTVSYDFDPWGRLRRQTEAAAADLLATEYGVAALRLTLVADVTSAYFDLRSLDRQLAIARGTLDSRSQAFDLQKLRFDAGVISELELAQARSEQAATAATVPDLEQAIAETENRLAILLGRNPDGVARGRELEALVLPPAVPAGLPSALLARRPDLAAAEQRLVAANARIGVAKAAYFPSLALTGFAGTESTELSGLFTSGSFVWQAAASLVAPLFNAGRTRREVEAAQAREVQALESYRKVMQTTFAEVENALVARRTSAARYQALADQAAALQDALRLAQLRYDAGSSSYLEVLDAQRSLFRAQLDLAAARRTELAAAVALFEALGGGWSIATPEPNRD
jgi:outer membrane protein, multidrug efflux system